MNHKHADILIAIAEGKEVEFFSNLYNTWMMIDSYINPLNKPFLEYRVKPQEKIVYVGCEISCNKVSISNHRHTQLEETEHWDNTLKFTIAGNKILSVELLENK